MSTATEQDRHEVDLAIGGMTCASCSSRVERKLNRLDGVDATVNLATEKAHVAFPGSLSVADLIAVVERTGYTATDLTPAPAGATRVAGSIDGSEGSGGGAPGGPLLVETGPAPGPAPARHTDWTRS